MKGENKGFRWKKKGTKADEENKRLREKKGADSAKGEIRRKWSKRK